MAGLGSGGFIEITFQITGQRAVRQKLATWGRHIESLAPAWEQVGEDLLGDFTANFDSEGGGFGTFAAWPQLAASTIADRLRKGFAPGPMLERTGLLRQSVTERMTPGNLFLVEPNRLTVGTYVPYARFHQSGTSRMPARPIVGISWDRRSAIVKRLGDYVREQARQAGLRGA
jgi:phage gpG-like protein